MYCKIVYINLWQVYASKGDLYLSNLLGIKTMGITVFKSCLPLSLLPQFHKYHLSFGDSKKPSTFQFQFLIMVSHQSSFTMIINAQVKSFHIICKILPTSESLTLLTCLFLSLLAYKIDQGSVNFCRARSKLL